jgi:hypothetical protein
MLIANCMGLPFRAHIHSVAVGRQGHQVFWMQRDGIADFHLDGFGSALVSSNSTEKGLGTFGVNVAVINLRNLLGLIPSCGEYHIKIDIEGAEYDLDWESLPHGSHCYVEWHDWNNTVINKSIIQQTRPDITWHDWT